MQAQIVSARPSGMRATRRLAAILSADVKGYSALMAMDEEAIHRTTKSRIDKFLHEMAKFDGKVITLAGDGVLAEFGSAIDALKFAFRIQDKFAALNKRPVAATIGKIEFRIGINVGDLVLHEGAIGGDSANVAVRIESLAEPGGICISRAVFEQVHRVLHLDYTLIGKAQLKNISTPVEVFQVKRRNSERALPMLEEQVARKLTLPGRPSIAVLPFQNLTRGNTEAYFADGVTDDIITGLSRFRELFIIGRNSSFVYRERQVSPQDIARELGVRYILDGNLRQSTERIRVTAHLN